MAGPFNPDCLKGKVAFITGGGTGICYGIAEEFARHGCDLVITSRKLDRLQAAAAELQQSTGRRCVAVACDVRVPQTVEQAVDKALEEYGKIDILVNGAAGNFLAPAAALSYNGFKTVQDIDTNGTFNVSKAVFAKCFSQTSSGVIINITATLHYTGAPFVMHAGCAKAAIDAMTKHLANEWGSLGIRVNSVAPGPIEDTEGFSRLVPDSLYGPYKNSISLQRFGTRQDVARACMFLASDASSYVTGINMVVDGGAWMAGNALSSKM